MTILCGTDFTEPSSKAAIAAAALASRAKEDLVIVHVLDLPPLQAFLPDGAVQAVADLGSVVEQETTIAKERLRAVREGLARWGIKVQTAVLVGIADEALVAHAVKTKASTVVVSALGRRSRSLWRLGGTADRVAQISKVPVFVVRANEPIERWASTTDPLRVLAAVDLSSPSDAAVRWLASLAEKAPCDIVLAHVYWPPDQRERAGSPGSIPIGKGHPAVERAVEEEIQKRFRPLLGSLAYRVRVCGGLGRPADHLVQLAEEERAELIVVGNHQRTGIDRFWHGSVSHGVVERARTNVACVPST